MYNINSIIIHHDFHTDIIQRDAVIYRGSMFKAWSVSAHKLEPRNS